MMKPTRPQISKGASYPREFREAAVQYWLSSGATLAHVAADLGLSAECLRSWRKHIEAASPQTVANRQAAAGNELAVAREIGQLRRELEAMTSAQGAPDVTF